MLQRSYIVQGIEIDLYADSHLSALISDYFASLYIGASALRVKPLQYNLRIVKETHGVPANSTKAIISPTVTTYSNGKQIYFLSKHGSSICLDPVEMQVNGFLKEDILINPAELFPLVGASLVEILRYYGFFFLHAAALYINKVAYLISGDGGSGKTTATLSLVRAGFQYVTDDSLFLKDAGGEIVISPLYKHVHVDKDIARRFPEISGGKGLKIKAGTKVPIDISFFYPDAFIPSLKPDVIIFPVITSAGTSGITPVMQTEMYKNLLKQTVLAVDKHIAQEQLRIIGTLVRQTKGFALLSGRDMYEDSAILVGLLRKIHA